MTFNGLGIAPKLLEILGKLNFVTPTPIQHQSIPTALEGKDLMGIAQTGTGKTLAFGIPMIQRLAQNKGKGLILLPTRELAVQVDESLNKIGQPLGLKTAILIGGENIGKQMRQLRQNPHIIIATPGRLIDHLEQKSIKLDAVSILVLDEADRMLDMGFAPQIKKILVTIPKVRQTMLFSATMPPEIVDIARTYMQLPIRVEVAPAGSSSANVTQEVFFVSKDQKLPLLESLLKEYKGSVLVFTRTKFAAKKVAAVVRRMGHTSAEIHSNRSLNQRLEALNGFKIGKYRVMVATDIAARGIDVTGIELVLNYDLPAQAEDYVHRIGRTGRASLTGHAISFATPDQKFDVRSIERLIKKQLPVSQLPGSLPKTTPAYEPARDNHRPFSPRPHSQRRQEARRQGGPKRHDSRDFNQPQPFESSYQARGESGKGYFIQKPPRPGKFNQNRGRPARKRY
jgi:ATP-dependent RNA helicase RhlE